ncbi:MAG: secretin N-terminal domain-containing protein [Sulfuricellaceae bacterium]
MRGILLRYFFLLLLGLPVAAVADQTVLEVLPLNYRSAEEMLPLIRPFVDSQGTVSGLNNRLIVRSTPKNLAELRKLLAELDRPPRRLLITVRQGGSSAQESSGVRLSGEAEGRRGRLSLPDDRSREGAAVEYRSGGNAVKARIYGTRTMGEEGITQQLQVVEGWPAFIQAGKTIPVPQQQTIVAGSRVIVQDTTSYQDATSGFYVLPRVSGNHVTLEINPQRNTVGDRPGEINIRRMNTVVSGRLGEWLEIGGVSEERSDERSGTVYSTRSLSTDQQRVLLKVEELP